MFRAWPTFKPTPDRTFRFHDVSTYTKMFSVWSWHLLCINSGECWSGLHGEETYAKIGVSNNCQDKCFEACKPYEKFCAGKNYANAVYRLSGECSEYNTLITVFYVLLNCLIHVLDCYSGLFPIAIFKYDKKQGWFHGKETMYIFSRVSFLYPAESAKKVRSGPKDKETRLSNGRARP